MTLEVTDISCSRANRPLFNNVSFTLNAGQALVIEGENGSGKSTLLKIISGLRQPDSGSVMWNKQLLENADDFAQDMIWISHRNGINESLTAKENIQLTANLNQYDSVNFNAVLERVGLKGFQHTPVRQFSAGMKRRLALSRLLIKPAKLWLLDEPQGALDKSGISLLDELIEQHVSNNGMVVMSSHHDVTFSNITVNTLTL